MLWGKSIKLYLKELSSKCVVAPWDQENSVQGTEEHSYCSFGASWNQANIFFLCLGSHPAVLGECLETRLCWGLNPQLPDVLMYSALWTFSLVPEAWHEAIERAGSEGARARTVLVKAGYIPLWHCGCCYGWRFRKLCSHLRQSHSLPASWRIFPYLLFLCLCGCNDQELLTFFL